MAAAKLFLGSLLLPSPDERTPDTEPSRRPGSAGSRVSAQDARLGLGRVK